MADKRKGPVFVINGFLESGKTTFIRNAILRDPNILKEQVLIIVCEEGETEYDSLPKNIDVYTIDEKDKLTSNVFTGLCKNYEPTYVIIEYNGVWGMQTLYNTKMPYEWALAQQITIIDAKTFESYFSNMKSVFADMLRNSSRVFMNRCTRNDDFKFYKDNIKSCAPRTDIAYVSDEEGRMDIIFDEDLPYDINSEVISINKDNYLIWYVDTLDNVNRYLEKTVEYVGIVAKPDYFRQGYFVVGNEVMTCCEDDMQFLGFVCKYDKAEFLKEGNTVKVQGKIHYEFAPEYESEGPVLYIKKATSMTKPHQKKKKKKK